MRLRTNLAYRVLTSLAVLAAIGVLVAAGLGRAFIYVGFLPVLTLAVAIGAVIFSSGRSAAVSTALAAASVGLAIAGWGFPLSPRETALALEKRHPNYSGPASCHRVNGGGLMRQRYSCNFSSFPSRNDSFLLDVNDARIVEEYP